MRLKWIMETCRDKNLGGEKAQSQQISGDSYDCESGAEGETRKYFGGERKSGFLAFQNSGRTGIGRGAFKKAIAWNFNKTSKICSRYSTQTQKDLADLEALDEN